MQITSAALSLNVPDVAASAGFLSRHLGFTEEMSADGFVSLSRPDCGFNVIFLRTGLPSFQPPQAAGSAGQGLLVAFVVDDIDAAHAQMVRDGVPILTELQTEPWGERFFQVADPNGVVLQLVQWVDAPGGT